ncbi:MAG: SGNH/GDSL hydrolase family protein [Methylocystis sp.]
MSRGISMRSAAQIVGNIFIATIFILLGVVSLELVARVVDASRTASRSQDALPELTREKIDKGIKNLVVAFDGRYTYDQIPKIFPMMFGLVSYKPWIQIGNTDHNNPFSVVVDGVRKTVESKKCGDASNGEERAAVNQKVVWFFGGSTTFGQGVPWWDTIPSKFVEEAERNGVCVVAVNFGVPFHFSRQEAMNFSSRLMKEQRTPDAVVFLDGMNDLMFPGSAIRSEPFFTPTLYKLVPVNDNPSTITRINPPAAGFLSGLSTFFRDLHVLKWVGLSRGADAEREEAYSNNDPPQSAELSTDEQVVRKVVDQYIKTRKFISNLCEGYSIRCFQFLQPVAAIDYNAPEGEVLTEDARKPSKPIFATENKWLRLGSPLMREAFR